MKQLKRVFAFLLSLCLLFPMLPVMPAAAASTEFSITGIQNYTYRTANSDWYIILNTDNAELNLSAAESTQKAGVTVDGVATTGWFQPGTGTLAFDLDTDKANHKVVLPAGMVVGGYTLKEDYVFFTQADGNIRAGVSITGVSGAYNNQYIVYLNTDKAYTLTNAQALTVNVDGSDVSVWLNPAATPFISGGSTITKGDHKVVIPAGTQLGNCVLVEDYVFCTYADGSVGPAAFNITGIKSFNYRTANSDWYIILNTDNAKFNLSATASTQKAGVTVDGVATTGWFQPGTGTLAFDLDTDKAEHEVVLPAGMKLGNYVLENEYVFYTHTTGYADNIAPLSITGVSGGYNNQYLVYLNTDKAYTLTAPQALTVNMDGSNVSVWLNPAATPFISGGSTIPMGEHKIVIPAGTMLGNCKLTSDYVFYTHADGKVDNKPPVINITGISGGYNSQYVVYLNTDKAYTLTANQALTINVDGSNVSVWLNVAETPFISGGSTIPMGEHKVVIPAGTKLGEYTLEKDYVFYTHANGSVDASAPVINITGVSGGYNNQYIVTLNTDKAYTLTGNQALTLSVDGSNVSTGIWLNVAETPFISWAIPMGEHEVVIPAGTKLGEYTLEKDYVFYTHADGSVNTIPYINITGVSGGYNNQYIVYLTTDKAYTLTANQALTINVDGSNVSVWLNAAETPFISWATTKDEHKVIIPAGTMLGNSKLASDYVFYTHADGSVDTKAPVINITGIQNFNYRDSYSDWYIVLNVDNAAFSLPGAVALNATIDGAPAAGWFQPTSGTLEFDLDTDKAEHKVVIPAGTVLGDYMLENAFTFYTHANGTVNTVPHVNITEISGGYNNQYIVYLTTDRAYTLTGNQALTVNVDGSAVSVWLNTGEVPFISSGSAITMDEHIIVIPAGTQLGDSMLGEDFTFYTHADGTVDMKEPIIDEPVYPVVNLTVKNENGQTVMNRSVTWTTNSIALVEQELKATVADGKILLGYMSGESLYASIGNISVAEGNVLDITLKTLDLAVHTEIRHGEDMADSGLRFVATLGQTDYIPKVLLVSETLENLTVANAQWKIGNPFHTEEKPFMQITTADGKVCYSIALANIPAADYNKTYYARAGVLVTYADIGQNYAYTDAVASTVNEAAEGNWLATEAKTEYVNGVMVLDADANLIGNRNYTISVSNDASHNYVIAYTGGSVKVSAVTIGGLRFTTQDGMLFGNGTLTIPSGLFAAAKLEQELEDVADKMDIGAYYGPSIGTSQYTESSGSVTDTSITRTHDAVYADVEDYFNAGFNIWMAEDWAYGGKKYSENDAFSALDLAAEYCIKHGLTNKDIQVLITDGFINGLLDGTDMNNGDRNSVEQYAAIASNNVNALINYKPVVNGVQVGAEYNCFAGFLLRDEPYYDHLRFYAPWFSFLAADADQTVTVTAWNTNNEQISGEVSCLGLLEKGYTLYFSMLGMGAPKSAVVSGSTSANTCSEAEYLAYVNQFVNNVNATVWNHENMVLAFDNYGLYTEASTSFGSTTINYTEKMSANWQQNYALFADIIESKGGNATFATALRSDGMVRKSLGGRWSSKTWKEFQAFDASWGEEAISMQAYTALAHGYNYINYYTYWEPSRQAYSGETYTDACVMWDANMNPVKQNLYYWVQSANAEVRQLENLIANFSYVDTAAIADGNGFYTGTGNVGGTDMGGLLTAAQLAEKSALASISASKDTTAGYFTKADGQFKDMFILVNMSHPNQAASDTVSMTFDAGYTCVIVYLDGAASIYQLDNGQCSVTLPSGEGAVIIPVA